MVDTCNSGETSEGCGRIYFVSSNGMAETLIWQVGQERWRVGGLEHGHKRVSLRPGTSVYWDRDRRRPYRRMILCGNNTGVGGGGVGAGGGVPPPQKDSRWREERVG